MNQEIPKQNDGHLTPEVNGDVYVHEDVLDFSNKLISRRKFLKVAGFGIASAAVGGALPVLYEGAWNTIGKDELENSIEKLETELSEKYGIRIKVWEDNQQ